MTNRDANGKFVKGESGNPSGRPKMEMPLTDLIDACITLDDWKDMIKKLKPRFIRGEIKVIELIMDRRFGKAIQFTDNKHDGTLNVVIEWGGKDASNPES